MRYRRLQPILFGIALAAAAAPAAAQNRAPLPGDAAIVANAILAANNGNPGAALALRARTQDTAARKLIAWYVFSRREGRADFAEVSAFLAENERWPLIDLLARTADRSITAQTPAPLLLAWYARRLPESGDSLMAAVTALKAQSKAKEAQELLRRAWAQVRLTDSEEADILRHYGAELRSEDHAERIGHLVSLGQKRVAQALLHRLTLDPPHRATVEARLKLRDEALRLRPAEVEAAVAAAPDSEKAKEGFQYDLMRWHRRGNRNSAALAVATALPAKLEAPERWWKEFDILIRNAIAARQFEAAYALASNHRQVSGESLAEAEFLAGYIALRLLKRPEAAEKHFAAIAQEKIGGWDIARLAYWRGRAAEARGDKVKGAEYFAAALKFSGAFYGQIAASHLGRKDLALDAAAAANAPQDAFWNDEIVRAAHLLRAAGDARNARLFAIRAAWNGGWTTAQHAYLAKFILDLTVPDFREQTAVRLAKLATRDGAAITTMGFPALDLPQASAVEPALVYAVIRQESEFVVSAKSHAGARGLMQLMPFTAKLEAGDAKLPYLLDRLTTNAAYNLRLGTQHLQRLSDYYQGSYPLMVAAYNAGVGRVDRWLAVHGDPRKGGVEWSDWIELIPFDETRAYTKFVLENHAIYRLRLGDKLDLPRIATHWQAPRSDAELCRLLLNKETAEPPPVPLSGQGAAPPADDAKTRATKKKAEPLNKIDTIPLAKKEKPDNVAGVPSC